MTTLIFMIALVLSAYARSMEQEKEHGKRARAHSVSTTQSSQESEEANRLLREAAKKGNIELANMALNKGASINTRDNAGREPLHHAARRGHLDVVEWFLEHGATIHDQNNFGWKPIHFAARGGHLKIVEWLLRQGATIHARDNNGWEPLHFAAHGGHLNIVEWLVKQGATVHDQDNHGWEAVHYAAHEGHLNVVESLLGHGATIHDRDRSGWKPIHFAARGGHLKIVEWLLRQGATIHARDNDGWKPIHFAAQGGHLKVVEWLLQQGATIHDRDNNGWKPIHFAAYGGHPNMVEWLLGHGATIHDRDNNGREPLHIAAQWGQLKVVEWLLAHGACADNISELLSSNALSDKLARLPLIQYVLEGKREEIEKHLEQEQLNVEEIRRALLLMIAFKQQSLVASVLKNKAVVIDSQTLRKALETAAATNNLGAFEQIYAEVFNRLGGEIVVEDFLDMLENALYWAAISKNEEIISFILECALARGHVAHLSLSRAGEYLARMIKHSTSPEEKGELRNLKQRLVNAARIQESVAIRPRLTSLEDAASRVFALVPALPLELATLLLSFALHPSESTSLRRSI